ncbi:MFS transporter [Namhaeicola litoreus]|uniref:MFS transporter n=1 Tax=Namhaeicola litoreus TaxID=1052145 RepID=A0ABW3XYH4_9FLAO
MFKRKTRSLFLGKTVYPPKRKLALSENALLRYFTFSSLYTAQGIPEGLTYFAIPAWLAMNGKSPAEIGSFVAAIGIPWSFKILVAPIMDRYTYLPMGRKRPWVIIGQLGLIITLLCTSLINNPLDNLPYLIVAGFFISFFGAFQDVAVDGMAIDILPIEEQARANGLMWGSKTIGISLSLLVSTWVINHYGLPYATALLAFSILIILLVPVFILENLGEKLTPWTKGQASLKTKKAQVRNLKQIFFNLKKVFFLPSSLILGAAVFIMSIGYGLMEALLPVFTIQEIGWTNARFSEVTAMANIVAGILGMFVAGALVDYFGKIKMLNLFLWLSITLILLLILGKQFWKSSYFVPAFILGYYILYTFQLIAIFSIAMELCWKRISATQFTLYMAISNLGRATGAGFLGEIKHFFTTWEFVISVYALAAVIMLFFISKVNTKTHLLSVGILEKQHQPLNN